ncbi:MAG: hypothetical protein AAF126_00380 [Chloroflexota bacterium]
MLAESKTEHARPLKPLNILDLYDYQGKVHEWADQIEQLTSARMLCKGRLKTISDLLKWSRKFEWSSDQDMQDNLNILQDKKVYYSSKIDLIDESIETLQRALNRVGKPSERYMGWEDSLDILVKFASGENSVLHMHDARTRRGTAPERTVDNPDDLGSSATISAEPEGRFDVEKLERAARSVGGSFQAQETKAFSKVYKSYFLFVPYIVAEYVFHNMEYSRGGYKNPPPPTKHCLYCGKPVGDEPVIVGLGNHTFCSIDHAWLGGALGWDYKVVEEMKKERNKTA